MLKVSIDSAPLHGPRTGIGVAVAATIDALDSLADVDVDRYVLSARAKTSPGERRLPLPAGVANRVWARTRRGRMDRWLGSPDVVHGTNYVVPPSRAPSVVSVYDCWFLDNPERAAPGFANVDAALRRAVDAGTHVVTSSDATSDRVRELLGVEATTIHLGPPTATTPPAGRPSTLDERLEDVPFLLSIGTGERRKNLPTLVDAFARVAGEHAEVRLVIAGRDGDDAPAIDLAMSQLTSAVRDRVHRLRSVDEPTKHWLLHHARALAYPSLDEGFGFPILEAHMAGIPVVASSAGSIPEVSGPAALLSLPSDADALAANLYWVVTSDVQHERLVRLGHTNLERFSWSATADALRDVYVRLASQS